MSSHTLEIPRRPLSAYFIFQGEQRPQVVKQNPGLKSKEIASLLGERWKGMSDEQKAAYQGQAQEAKDRYQEQLARYKEAYAEQHEGQAPPTVVRRKKKSKKETPPPVAKKLKQVVELPRDMQWSWEEGTNTLSTLVGQHDGDSWHFEFDLPEAKVHVQHGGERESLELSVRRKRKITQNETE